MAVRLLPPGFQFHANDGTPLDSGKIYTYETGTSTNKTTYTDAGAGTPNANPVVLDSNGRADIWLDVDVAYRIVVKDSADNTIDTVDNVLGPLDLTGDVAFLGDIALSDGKGIEDDSNNEHLIFQKTASAVNYFEMTNAATGNDPQLSVAGDDASIGMKFKVKGSSGSYTFDDHNDNPLLILGPGTASAVNYFTINNAATGNPPDLTITGTDTNVDFNFQAKGTGVYNFKPTSDTATEIRWFEDTDNGSNYFGLKAAASTTASVTYTWPAADGSSGAVLVTDGSGTLSWDTGTLSAAASQAQMETGTSTTVFSSPGRQQYHPGHPKCWLRMTGQGTIGIDASYNIDSLVDNGTADYTVNIDTDFSAAEWCWVATASTDTAYGTGANVQFACGVVHSTKQAYSASSVRITCSLAYSRFETDPEVLCLVGFGDQ